MGSLGGGCPDRPPRLRRSGGVSSSVVGYYFAVVLTASLPASAAAAAAGSAGAGGGGKVGLPALDVALAFPQATPASLFPPAVADYYQFDDLLTDEEKALRKKVQGIMEKEIAPIMTEFCGSSSFMVQIYSSCGGSQKITSCINPDPEVLEDVPHCTVSDHHVSNGNEIPHLGHVPTPAGFEYFTSGGCRLTKVQDNKVLEMARTIKSEIPIYVAVMNKSNVDLNGCSIRIPSLLMKDVREEVLKATIKLEAPDGNVYGVSATQGDDEIVLQSGWDAFVVGHHVQERDLIIFRHKGNCRFEVFILDTSGHQKTSLWFGMGNIYNAQEMNDDSVEIVEPPHKTVDIIDLSSSSDENSVAAYNVKSARRQKQQLGHRAKTRRMTPSSPSIKSEHGTHKDLQGCMVGRVDCCSLNINTSEGPTGSPYIISRLATLSRAQEKMVFKKVQAIRSRFPIYVAVINTSCTGEGRNNPKMTFTREYYRTCLPSGNQNLTLELEGRRDKEWPTLLHVQGGSSSSRGQRTISHGWADFVHDNHLVVGDICLFELLKANRSLRMKVHLIRKAGAHV